MKDLAKIIKINSDSGKVEKTAVTRNTESADHYEKLVKQNPLDQKSYSRLMIIYRKKKEYKKEMKIINAAIRSFEAFYRSHRKSTTKQIQSISHKLNPAMGLVDRKGKFTHDKEPIATWKRRRELLEKKMSCELWVVGCGLWVVGCEFRIASYSLLDI